MSEQEQETKENKKRKKSKKIKSQNQKTKKFMKEIPKYEYKVQIHLIPDNFYPTASRHLTKEDAELHLKQVKQGQYNYFRRQWGNARAHVRGCFINFNQEWLDLFSAESTESFLTQFVKPNVGDRYFSCGLSIDKNENIDSKKLSKTDFGKTIMIPNVIVRTYLHSSYSWQFNNKRRQEYCTSLLPIRFCSISVQVERKI